MSLVHGPDAPANGLDHCDGDAVACLLVGLGVRVDGEDLVDLLIVKALQAQALPGHQAADASAALHNALHTGGVMGDTDPDPTGACGAARTRRARGGCSSSRSRLS